MCKRKLLSPMTGQVRPLTAGVGFAVESCAPVVYAPAGGRVHAVSSTPAAVEIRTADGLSVTVCPGGCCCMTVLPGDRVRAGEVIACMTGRGAISVLIRAPAALRGVVLSSGAVTGGRTAVMRYRRP